MTHVYSIFDVLFLVCMKQCVRWNTIAVKPSEKAVNSRVCESKLHGKSICLFLWGLMNCWFSSRQNDYSCTVYQKWESWPCLVTFHCSWNDAHNRDLWRYQVWYVFLFSISVCRFFLRLFTLILKFIIHMTDLVCQTYLFWEISKFEIWKLK